MCSGSPGCLRMTSNVAVNDMADTQQLFPFPAAANQWCTHASLPYRHVTMETAYQNPDICWYVEEFKCEDEKLVRNWSIGIWQVQPDQMEAFVLPFSSLDLFPYKWTICYTPKKAVFWQLVSKVLNLKPIKTMCGCVTNVTHLGKTKNPIKMRIKTRIKHFLSITAYLFLPYSSIFSL